MDISTEHDAFSHSDSEEFDTTQLTLTRLSQRNLTAKWGHGQSLSLFNISKRVNGSVVDEKTKSNSDSFVLAFSWDNVLVARQVRPSKMNLS
jgi:hypothetical protein